MKNNEKFARGLIRTVVAVCMLYVAHKIRLFAALGIGTFVFSGITMIAPALYALVGAPMSVLLLMVGRIVRLFGFSFPCATITMGLPTEGSILVWHVRESLWGQRIMNVVVPLLAILFFISSPGIGVGAWYASFWLIPIGLHFFVRQTLLVTALQATFIAHALGSCLWLMAIPMTPEAWVALMPIVCVERLIYALVHWGCATFFIAKKEDFLDFILSLKQAF